MTAPTARTHVDALTNVLTTAGLAVHVSQAPATAATPYVVLHPDAGTAEATSLADQRGDLVLPFQVTAVGATPEQALWAADKARGALTGATPAVSGRSVIYPIDADVSVPVGRDDNVEPPLFLAITRWTWRTAP